MLLCEKAGLFPWNFNANFATVYDSILNSAAAAGEVWGFTCFLTGVKQPLHIVKQNK